MPCHPLAVRSREPARHPSGSRRRSDALVGAHRRLDAPAPVARAGGRGPAGTSGRADPARARSGCRARCRGGRARWPRRGSRPRAAERMRAAQRRFARATGTREARERLAPGEQLEARQRPDALLAAAAVVDHAALDVDVPPGRIRADAKPREPFGPAARGRRSSRSATGRRRRRGSSGSPRVPSR